MLSISKEHAVTMENDRCKQEAKALTSACHAAGTVPPLSACHSAAMDFLAFSTAASQSKACWYLAPDSSAGVLWPRLFFFWHVRDC